MGGGFRRLMVIVPDRISDILVKGEYQPNYYNPGELFDDVHIVTTTDDRPDLAALQRTVGRARLEVHNVPEQPQLVTENWRRWWKKPLRDWAAPGVRLAGDLKPQLIRCHGADWNTYLAHRIKRSMGTPYVVSLHINPDINAVRRVVPPVTETQRLQNQFFEYIEHTGLRSADLVMPVYRSILPYLRRHGVERVDVCYNILNGPELRQKSDYVWRDRFRIICVGRLIPEKNPVNIIKAIVSIPEAELTIVGDGPERATLEGLTQELGVGQRVQFKPAVANDELCAILPTFDLFAVHTEYWELNKSVLEALLTGLPLVINRRSGEIVPELAGADFVRVVDNTAISYHDNIVALMRNDAEREALGRRAFAHAQAQWSPAVTERKVVDIYRRTARPAS